MQNVKNIFETPYMVVINVNFILTLSYSREKIIFILKNYKISVFFYFVYVLYICMVARI